MCVHKQIIKYIEKNNILSEFQAGFRSDNSCECALQSVVLLEKCSTEKEIGRSYILEFLWN